MTVVQHSLFEEGYLRRDLRAVAELPEVALAELVANAWDAGASEIDVLIPLKVGDIIRVSDNGVGMSSTQFRDRWMKHGYNRTKHQGQLAEFPPERGGLKRMAYGRNGIGRHGMLCFADQYIVETRRHDDDAGHRFKVCASSGKSAFDLVSEETCHREGHGTTISTQVEWKLPDPVAIADALSFEFIPDPTFVIRVNGRKLDLDEFAPVGRRKLRLGGRTAEVLCIKSPSTRRWRTNHGVAFWIGGRLVGDPVYNMHGIQLLDGRTTVANRYLFVVRSDDYFDDIESDWSKFKRNRNIEALANGVSVSVGAMVAKLLSGKIRDKKSEAIRQNRDDIRELKPLAKIEISEFLDNLTTENPTLNVDVLTSAVKAAVNLEKSRSGQLLLEKLATVSEDDADAVNQLLDTWTARDAMIVLDEIDRRLTVVEALEKLMADPDSDELHSLHPLVSHARWLFGPEFDSPIYSSNVSIRTAAAKVFKKQIDKKAIRYPRRRPDLIFLKDATISLTGTEKFDEGGTITNLEHLLLVELKKGNSTICIEEMQQAERYVIDLLNCGLLDGHPYVRCFVAGHYVDDASAKTKIVGTEPILAKIEAVTYGQLVRTAHLRLFKLQKQIGERYKDIPGAELVNKVLGEPQQTDLFGGRRINRGKRTQARKSVKSSG